MESKLWDGVKWSLGYYVKKELSNDNGLLHMFSTVDS